ncbi:MAG: LysM peptidoglycan-binding domain-containing protein [Firmicutes bacterium]|nr:LysM peptidoglycan-binding domain-containing protein [Bacillota bacterium]
MEKKGIDVSYHQGTINWELVKPNIDFAILRCGYGKDIVNQDDKEFVKNANECTRLGIPFGVYLYSYAKNTSDAASEANHVLRLIKNYKLEYPVFYDVEDRIQEPLTNEQLTNICTTFCNILEENNYYVGIYANLFWLTTKLNSAELDKYDKWLAEWRSEPSYTKPYGMWQYTSNGTINGINTRVDMNVAYKDYPKIIRDNNLNNLESELLEITYTVVKGDSLWKIGNMYGVKWIDIAKLNNIKIPYIIKPGQVLRIPVNNTIQDFKIGDKVEFVNDWNIYTSNSSNTPIKAKYNGGTITKIYPDSLNQLQLNNNRGYVRKSDVKKI